MKNGSELRRAVAGGAFWLFIWLRERPEVGHEDWSVQLLLLAPLVLVPLGLGLYRRDNVDADESPLDRWLWRFIDIVQLPAALMLAVSFTRFHTGPTAGALVLPWMAVTAVLAAVGLLSAWRRSVSCRGVGPLADLCRDAALVYIVVGGFGAVMYGIGMRPLGFAPVIILLTAVHFHYAAFVLPLLAGLAARRVGGVLGSVTSLAVIAGVPLVAVGINATQVGVPPYLETAAACVMVAGGLLAVLLHVRLVLDSRWPLVVRALWATSAAGLGYGMVLAAMYAVRFYADLGWLIIPKMSAWHGTANALVFALVGIVAWRIALDRQATQPAESPQ